MPSYLLALNCGSSSLKSTLYSYPGLEQVASVSASSIGSDSASLKTKYTRPRRGSLEPKNLKGESHAEIFQDILRTIENELPEEVFRGSKEDIKVVTHRIVHGGTFDEPVVVTKDHTEALKKMDELSAFAPLHNHHAVLTVRAVLDKLPTAKNLLCFDTLFHRSIPAHIYSYPIEIPDHAPPVPLRRYGFHGLSYSSILKKVANHLDKKEEQTSLIVCHLGSGASMACIKDGKSWDTTMGLTPLEGLPGGTRSGSVDPSLIFHLYPDPLECAKAEETKGMEISKGELVLNKASGFKGLCGTNEFAEISQKATEQEKQLGPQEKGAVIQPGEEKKYKELLAVRIFENRILNYLGSYLVALRNAPDAIIFSGGIGEKSVSLRASLVSQLSYLGIEADGRANQEASSSDDDVVQISTKDSKIKVLRVLTDEEGECASMAVSRFGKDV